MTRALTASEGENHSATIYLHDSQMYTTESAIMERPILGTSAPDVVELENVDISKKKEFEEVACKKRDELEDEGFGIDVQKCTTKLQHL